MASSQELLEIKQRLALIETRLQQLFEHLDLRPRETAGGGWWGGSGEGDAPDPATDPEIQDLLAKGNEIQAIKRYREFTGLGLAEAKEAIERAKAGG
jgi:ribosomal protein L7/L12